MRSEEVKLGSTRAAHRSLFYAMGYTEEDLKKPLIGVVNAQNEIIPGHMHLDQIAKAVKHGILAAGGTPIEFPAIGICDGIAMGHNGMKYPLASRELVADSIEAVANGHAFDGLVLFLTVIKSCRVCLWQPHVLIFPQSLSAAGLCFPDVLTEPTSVFPLFLKPPVVLKQEKSTKQNSASSNMPHAQAAAAVLVCSLLTL